MSGSNFTEGGGKQPPQCCTERKKQSGAQNKNGGICYESKRVLSHHKNQYNFSFLLIWRAYNLTVFTCHVDYHGILLHSSLFRNLNQKNRSLSVQLLIFLLVRPEFYLILCSSVLLDTICPEFHEEDRFFFPK